MTIVATCWSRTAASLAGAVRAAALRLDAAGVAPADGLVEARLDLLSRPAGTDDLDTLAASARGRLLATCRPGGPGAPATASDRLALLARLARQGAVAVDVERDSIAEVPARAALPEFPARAKVVASAHVEAGPGFSRDHLAAAAARLADGEPDVVKLAAPTDSGAGALDLALAGAALRGSVGWAPVPLGRAGAWLRLLAGLPSALPGRPWSFLAYAAAGEPLPGAGAAWQPALEDVLAARAFRARGPWPAVLGVFGWPLATTWSPILHAAAFRARGVHAVMVRLPARSADEVTTLGDSLRLAGAAVTAPHKAAALSLASSCSAAASSSRAANTLRRAEDGSLHAESFDGEAARGALEAVAGSVAGRHALVLGAGGAAGCVAASLAAAGAAVTLAAREPAAVEGHALRLGARVVPWRGIAGVAAEILVNATPLGGEGAPPLDVDALPWAGLRGVLDATTHPPRTALLSEAARRGVPAADGLAWLARQAAAQQRAWSGLPTLDGRPALPPPCALWMERTLRRLVAAKGAA